MIEINSIDLTERGVILPSDRVGMVIAQPYLTLTPQEPFRCITGSKPKQLDFLTKTLAVSLEAQHGSPKTHFTIFPEYSIPGLEGVALIDDALSKENWPIGTFLIGGTDALSKADYATLADLPGSNLNTQSNGLDRVDPNEWVNCGITWVKSADGTVERWLQPKLSRAWPEQNITFQDMFLGSAVFTFKGALTDGTNYRFSTLVCFDWIANIDSRKVWRWVVDGLQQQAEQAGAEQIPVSWFFIIQHNRKPSDNTFLNEVAGFFDQRIVPMVRREHTCLVFANSAGKDGPGRTDFFGSTSIVFSQQTLFEEPKCHPTFCNGGKRFRDSTLLSAQRDLLFRERGACIHSFTQVNPSSLNAGAAGKTIALERAFVYPFGDTIDPRTPSSLVPACVKWFNDELDNLQSLSVLYPSVFLAGQATTAHKLSMTALRMLPAQFVAYTVKLATARSEALCEDKWVPKETDEWGQKEAEAIEHLTHTLNILRLGFPDLVVGSDTVHATVSINNVAVDLVAIRGDTHETCIKYSKIFLPSQHRQTILVSRDRDNNRWSQRYGSFLETNDTELGQERKFTDPTGGVLHLGYRKLLDIFQNSEAPMELKGAIHAELAP